jgi:hypothetical protein
MLKVLDPDNVNRLAITSESVPAVTAVVVTVPPFTRVMDLEPVELSRKSADRPAEPLFVKEIESTDTVAVVPPMLLVDVVAAGVPEKTSEKVPLVVGVVVQLPAVPQLLPPAVPVQVVTVMAEAVLAATSPMRAKKAAQKAVVAG